MKIARLLFALPIIFFLSLNVISAGDIILDVKVDDISFDIYHGQSASTTFTITNENTVCNLYCDYNLIKDDDEIISSGSFTSEGEEDPKDLKKTFYAPTKSELRDTGGEGTITYNLKVKCSESGDWFCTSSEKEVSSPKITLNYGFTPEEEEARDYLSTKLEKMSSDLGEIESKIYSLETKLDDYPNNVLISDLENSLSGYGSLYNSLKQDYDSVKSFYEDLEYLSAKSRFKETWLNQLSELKSNLGGLEEDIKIRLQRHNEIIEKINLLQEKFLELEGKLKVLDLVKPSLETEINSLVDNFERGNFESYDSIEDSIENLEGLIDESQNEVDTQFKEIVSKGESLLIKEKSKINFKQETSISAQDISRLKSICNELQDIKISFEKENKKITEEYNLELNKINSYNEEINSTNDKLSKVISLRENISEMVNYGGIKEFNISACQTELEKISKLEDFSEFNQENYKNCSELEEKLKEAKKQKEGFLFNFLSFFRRFWFKSYNLEEIKLKEKRSLPEEPDLLNLEEDSKKFATKYCEINLTLEKNTLYSVEDVEGDILTNSDVEGVIEKDNLCCAFGECQKCCENNECADDEESYPIIFLHGHSFKHWNSPEYSLDAFNDFQEELNKERYIIGGTFLPSQSKSDMAKGELGKVRFPTTVKATYYYQAYNLDGTLINEPAKYDSISTYARRLEHLIDLIKYRTGRNKVNIVAHSMGGLVAREYIKDNKENSDVHKLIMIGTPNHGIYGQVDTFCTVPGADKECAQMKADSDFINSLNEGDKTPGDVEYYTIAGSGCFGDPDGDGISRVESVQLQEARNVIIKKKYNECWNTFNRDLHSNLLDTSKYPETLEYVKEFLEE